MAFQGKALALNRFVGTWSLSLCSGILLISATIHRLGLESPGYTSSPLIHVEMIMMIFVALLVLVQPLLAIFLCFKRRWRQLGIVAINTVVGIGALYAAMHIDSPTLIHMT